MGPTAAETGLPTPSGLRDTGGPACSKASSSLPGLSQGFACIPTKKPVVGWSPAGEEQGPDGSSGGAECTGLQGGAVGGGLRALGCWAPRLVVKSQVRLSGHSQTPPRLLGI